MSLKQVSLFSLFIISVSSLHASEAEQKLAHLNKEFKIAEQQHIKAIKIAKQIPQWLAYSKTKKRIPGYVNDDFKAFQYAAEEFYATEEGQQVAYWNMKKLALCNMQNYIQDKKDNIDKKSMKRVITATLYDEKDLYVADVSEPTRKTVKKELSKLVNSIEAENKQ